MSRCMTSIPFAAAAAVALACGAATPALALDFSSQVDGLRISPLSQLGANPTPGKIGDCGMLIADPTTAAGRLAAKNGWAITGEAEEAGLSFVTFVGAAEQGPSGTCILGDGNLGIFKGETLQAVVYAPKDSDALSLGTITRPGSGGLRLHDGGGLGLPLADLKVDADRIALLPPAAEEILCGNRTVPNVYGKPIEEARATIARAGWQPASPPADAALDAYPTTAQDKAAFAARGITEVESCSGTGLGYCNFVYANAAGAPLTLKTIGDEPNIVVGIDSDCKAGPG